MPDESAQDKERTEQDSAGINQPEDPVRSDGPETEQVPSQLTAPVQSPYQLPPSTDERAITSSEMSELDATSRTNWPMLGGLAILLVLVLAVSLGFVEGWLDELSTMLLAGLIFALLVLVFFLFSRRRYHRS